MRDPGFAEDLPAEAAGIIGSVLPVELQELRVRPLDLERMRRGAKSDHRPASIQVIGNVLHFLVGEILEAQRDDQQVRGVERLEPRDVGTPRLDDTRLRVRRDEHAALEPVAFRQDSRERRKRFLGSILVVAGQKDDVLAVARTRVPFVSDEVRVLRGDARGHGQQVHQDDETGKRRCGIQAY